MVLFTLRIRTLKSKGFESTKHDLQCPPKSSRCWQQNLGLCQVESMERNHSPSQQHEVENHLFVMNNGLPGAYCLFSTSMTVFAGVYILCDGT